MHLYINAKTNVLLIFLTVLSASVFSQSSQNTSNTTNVTRQGFGEHSSYDTNLGFVNARPETDGTVYFFDNWETIGKIYTKANGVYLVEKLNINLLNNTLEAIYDESSVFTFDSDSILQVVINDITFRVIPTEDGLQVLELIYSASPSVYKHFNIIYSEASVNPMHGRKANKYIKNHKYVVYKNGELIKVSLSKKTFAQFFQTDSKDQNAILNFIKKNKLSLKDESNMIQVLDYIFK